ncbi:MAG: YceI family protein [Acidimicrobiales bacterium]|nr:YceI family protein [Acidimicrobiales bacterium]
MTVEIVAVRYVDGRAVPPAGVWRIDPSHSEVEFEVRHMMIAKVRGRFNVFEGIVAIAEIPEDSYVEVLVDAASIDTGDEQRDGHLRSADFLDVERYPTLRYRSTEVRPGSDDGWAVTGDLTIKDVTRPLTLEVSFNGAATDPWGNLRTAFSATGEADREEFGISWNQALEAGGFLVGKVVKMRFEVEAVLVTDPTV